ncbi:hypothetical protein [Thermincola ferriacetica]
MIEELHDHVDVIDMVPPLALWTTAIAAFPVIKNWRNGLIDKDECISRIISITGWKVVKVTALLGLLSFPLTAVPTGAYLFGRVIWSFYQVYKE